MKLKDMTIKARVIVTVLGIFVVSCLVMGYVTYTSQTEQVRDAAEDKM